MLCPRIACSAGVLLGQVNFKNLAVVYSTGHVWFGNRGGGGGSGQERPKISTPPFPPLSLFLQVHYKCLSLSNLPFPFKSKMANIIFAKKILSTHMPKVTLCMPALQASLRTQHNNPPTAQMQIPLTKKELNTVTIIMLNPLKKRIVTDSTLYIVLNYYSTDWNWIYLSFFFKFFFSFGAPISFSHHCCMLHLRSCKLHHACNSVFQVC